MVQRHQPPAGVPQRVFEQHAYGKGKPVERADALALQRAKAEDHRATTVERQVGSTAESIRCGGGHVGVGSVEWRVPLQAF